MLGCAALMLGCAALVCIARRSSRAGAAANVGRTGVVVPAPPSGRRCDPLNAGATPSTRVRPPQRGCDPTRGVRCGDRNESHLTGGLAALVCVSRRSSRAGAAAAVGRTGVVVPAPPSGRRFDLHNAGATSPTPVRPPQRRCHPTTPVPPHNAGATPQRRCHPTTPVPPHNAGATPQHAVAADAALRRTRRTAQRPRGCDATRGVRCGDRNESHLTGGLAALVCVSRRSSRAGDTAPSLPHARRALATSAPWLSRTPLGAPVVPDV